MPHAHRLTIVSKFILYLMAPYLSGITRLAPRVIEKKHAYKNMKNDYWLTYVPYQGKSRTGISLSNICTIDNIYHSLLTFSLRCWKQAGTVIKQQFVVVELCQNERMHHVLDWQRQKRTEYKTRICKCHKKGFQERLVADYREDNTLTSTWIIREIIDIN